MIGSRRRARSTVNVWPGYVDALSALLMLIIFMLLVYVVSQLYLSQTLSDRNTELAHLNDRLNGLSELLGAEEDRNTVLTSQLGASLQRNDELQTRFDGVRNRLMQISAESGAQEERLEAQSQAIADRDKTLEEKDEFSASQQDTILQLSNQIAALEQQLRVIANALELQEDETADREAELENVSRRLNTLLAERVSELEQYQSQFFSRLRDILKENENIRVVGDRFLLPSELLFASGSAQLGSAGQRELAKLAEVLLEVADRIPDDIDWILRIDGHTDLIPINTERFPSNWELSTARAVAVVRYLAGEGVPEQRMAAAGFGEFFPVAEGTSPQALQQNRRIELKLTDR
ncbi:peptidoglycan -binding protein [Marinobacter sp.]|uniref:peptidoglycan -binding protein n=1 Tax=Marinobacter sp. TaxID=50741 RepID=UPI0034A2C962